MDHLASPPLLADHPLQPTATTTTTATAFRMEPRKRGRPRKDPLAPPKSKPKFDAVGEFQCSACDFKAAKYSQAEKHVLVEHYGEARINDPAKTPLTDSERLAGYIKAQKLLKALKCSLCSKLFRSGLGYKCHLELCGKDTSETFRDCEICGKRLRLFSLPIHIRTLHLNRAKVATENGTDEAVVAKKAFTLAPAGKKRSSAIKALEHFKELSDDDESPDGESTTATAKKPKRKRTSSDDEYDFEVVQDEEDDDDDDEYEEVEEEEEEETEDEDEDEEDTVQERPVNDGVAQAEYMAERRFNYTKEWIKFLRENQRPLTYRCLAAMRGQWRMVLGSSATPSSIVPRFKLTKSMELSADNTFKYVPPLLATRVEDTFTFNVGHFVCSAAWAPMPMPSENETLVFGEMLDAAKNAHRSQYLAIATANFEESILNCNAQVETTPTRLPENSLQLWDMGPLESSLDSKAALLSPEAPLPRLALNIVHHWGDIQEMAWCPCASTFDEPEEAREVTMARLGLLALACEDGRVRLLSIPHPKQLLGSYDTSRRFNVDPILTLQPRFSTCKAPVNCLAWCPNSPQDAILGGFNDGTICLWQLTDLAKCKLERIDCTQHRAKVLRPKKWWLNPRHCPVLSIRWLNPMLFFTCGSDTCRLWHVRYDTPYGEYPRNIVQKLESHPLWYNTLIFADMSINRTNNLIFMKSFSNQEYTNSLMSNSERTKLHTVANVGKMRVNDMSLSPWMFILAYCTENGELFSSQVLPKPFHYPKKKLSTSRICKIHLGNLNVVSESEADEAPPPLAVEPVKPKRGRKKKNGPSPGPTKAKRTNQLINEVIDVGLQNEDFFLKYFFLFDDTKQPNLNRPPTNGKGSSAAASTSSTSTVSMYLTKNDLYRLYAFTNCSWNPNISAYTWLFTATKSGLCRLCSYPQANPGRLF